MSFPLSGCVFGETCNLRTRENRLPRLVFQSGPVEALRAGRPDRHRVFGLAKRGSGFVEEHLLSGHRALPAASERPQS